MDNIHSHLYAVIMAGGGGERFWPKSRQAMPKQLLRIFGKRSMIQATADRIASLVPAERLFVITNVVQAPHIREQLEGVPAASIVAEPFGRDTAACIALATAMVMEQDPDGIMVVLPADHLIKATGKLVQNLSDACRTASQHECLVTFGIAPTAPSTGYGYIHAGEKHPHDCATQFHAVKRFMEKPDRETAKRYLESGGYYWNSGMFVWKASAIAREFETHMPKLHAGYEKIRAALGTPERETVIEEVYSGLEKISIDYGIMEKAENVVVAIADFDWDDAGSWLAMERHLDRDENGNVTVGKTVTLDTKDCIIFSEEGITGCIGVKDLVIVKTSDAVLVCPKTRAQDVKKIVARLKENEELQQYV